MVCFTSRTTPTMMASVSGRSGRPVCRPSAARGLEKEVLRETLVDNGHLL